MLNRTRIVAFIFLMAIVDEAAYSVHWLVIEENCINVWPTQAVMLWMSLV